MAKIAVAGTGYVGLSLAVLLARQNKVIAVDIVPEKVELINNAMSPIRDPEIQEHLSSGALDISATLDGESAYLNADAIIVSTPTNYDDTQNEFDTSSVEQVVSLIEKVNPEAIVVIKSTIPVGYTDKLKAKYPDSKILFSPEFLREGRALYDNLHPSRIIVGVPQSDLGKTDVIEAAAWFANLLERAAVDLDVHVRIMAAREAEAVKLFANTYLAMRVAFFNELDTYADTNDMTVRNIIEGVTLDPRIGGHYCNPSFGYGGYCLPKDTKQLLANFDGIPQEMIGAVIRANEIRKRYISNMVVSRLHELGKDERTAIIGAYRLIMKSGSDNYRASAIQGVMECLQGEGYRIIVYEPTYKSDEFNGFDVEHDFKVFIGCCDVIVANRMDDCLRKAGGKVLTRDIFYRD